MRGLFLTKMKINGKVDFWIGILPIINNKNVMAFPEIWHVFCWTNDERSLDPEITIHPYVQEWFNWFVVRTASFFQSSWPYPYGGGTGASCGGISEIHDSPCPHALILKWTESRFRPQSAWGGGIHHFNLSGAVRNNGEAAPGQRLLEPPCAGGISCARGLPAASLAMMAYSFH